LEWAERETANWAGDETEVTGDPLECQEAILDLCTGLTQPAGLAETLFRPFLYYCKKAEESHGKSVAIQDQPSQICTAIRDGGSGHLALAGLSSCQGGFCVCARQAGPL
jgi:hypothetical protein